MGNIDIFIFMKFNGGCGGGGGGGGVGRPQERTRGHIYVHHKDYVGGATSILMT